MPLYVGGGGTILYSGWGVEMIYYDIAYQKIPLLLFFVLFFYTYYIKNKKKLLAIHIVLPIHTHYLRALSSVIKMI